jgi:hypothetical protein
VKYKYILPLILLLVIGLLNKTIAQGDRQVVQFSGIVIGEDSTNGLPGVYVYIPKAGSGTITDGYGFFSLPTFVGDSIIISTVGYRKQHFIIPKEKGVGLSVVVNLISDTTMLPVVEVYPYPTKELFKEAFLALQLPETQYGYMRKNLDRNLLAQMYRNTPMDGSQNYKYYMHQNAVNMSNRNFFPTLQLLNPFAWAEFIKSVKRGDLKKK